MKDILLFLILFIFVCVVPQLSSAQNISTIAGNGTSAYNGDGILATTAELNGPQGLAFDQAGNIYIADLANSRIRKITAATGLISTLAGTATQGYNGDGILAVNAQIAYPSALAFDGNGDLYFTDRGNNRIRKITMSTGIISTIAGNGTGGYNGDGIAATSAELSSPNEVAFDGNGNLYIADWNNNRVRRIDKTTGNISTIAGTGTAGYNGDGIAATTAQINGPCGITFDIPGNIYIAEYGGHRVRKIDIHTNLISTIAGTATAGYNGDGIAANTAELNGCAYIKFDALGNMFIGDAFNGRIREIAAGTGFISTVAGTGTSGYNADGIPAISSELNAPFYICFDQLNCNLYIADYANARIRKVTGGFAGCPVPVAKGNQVSCQVLPAITIDPANNNSWVPVFDSIGNIAAMINANGNNLGVVNTSLFTKTGTCRQDGAQRIYLNRNITITPQNQPVSGNVNVRLYLLKTELDSLKTAVNSLGQPSNVFSVNDVDLFQNNDACLPVGSNSAYSLSSIPGNYNTDYYLQAGTSSLSSFYFANKLYTSILPVQLSMFAGDRVQDINILKWQANCMGNTSFVIERSYDGVSFESIGTVFSGGPGDAAFSFSDNTALHNTCCYYYRLKISQDNATTSYSTTLLLHGDKNGEMRLALTPNLVSGSTLAVQVSTDHTENIDLFLSDIQGRIMLHRQQAVYAGSAYFTLTVEPLVPGVYWLYGIRKEGRTNVVQFVKQ